MSAKCATEVQVVQTLPPIPVSLCSASRLSLVISVPFSPRSTRRASKWRSRTSQRNSGSSNWQSRPRISKWSAIVPKWQRNSKKFKSSVRSGPSLHRRSRQLPKTSAQHPDSFERRCPHSPVGSIKVHCRTDSSMRLINGRKSAND